MAKISQFQEMRTIDEDGVIQSATTKTSYTVEAEPAYVKLYLDTILYLSDLPRAYNPILSYILTMLPWANQNQGIAINSGIKRIMAKKLNVSVDRISHALTDFVKGELLFRIETGVYQINPCLFGRGDWTDIKKLRMEVNFSAEGTTIMTKVEKHNDIKKGENIK